MFYVFGAVDQHTRHRACTVDCLHFKFLSFGNVAFLLVSSLVP